MPKILIQQVCTSRSATDLGEKCQVGCEDKTSNRSVLARTVRRLLAGNAVILGGWVSR